MKRQGSNADQGRAWQRMLSGRRLDLLEPSPLDIEIEDIAHGLARLARWNGQTSGSVPFSVAQHSLLVTDLAVDLMPDWPTKWRLAALLHDDFFLTGFQMGDTNFRAMSQSGQILCQQLRAIVVSQPGNFNILIRKG